MIKSVCPALHNPPHHSRPPTSPSVQDRHLLIPYSFLLAPFLSLRVIPLHGAIPSTPSFTEFDQRSKGPTVTATGSVLRTRNIDALLIPRLAVTAVVSEQDFATVLDRRLKRIEEMKEKAIEATPLIDGEKVDVRLPPVVPDRRFRRI